MSIRVLIADDEDGMRLVLQKAVQRHEDITIEAAVHNGQEALEQFETLRPDLVFLDVEMPVCDGLEAARRIQELSPDTPIVFVTAHESYRPQAFEVYATDYLVKPFSLERLDETLQRVRRQLALRRAAEMPPAPQTPVRLPLAGRILIKGRDETVLLRVEDIVLIKREERQSVVCTRDGTQIPTRDPLSEWETRLPADTFFRSHKSYILNLNYISRIYPYGRWTYITRLCGTKFDALLTRERYEALEQMLG